MNKKELMFSFCLLLYRKVHTKSRTIIDARTWIKTTTERVNIVALSSAHAQEIWSGGAEAASFQMKGDPRTAIFLLSPHVPFGNFVHHF